MKTIAVDPLVVMARLDTILERINRLKSLEQLTEGQFLVDETLQSAVERNLQIIAQAIIDICTHLVAHNHWGSPRTYSDVVKVIANKNIYFFFIMITITMMMTAAPPTPTINIKFSEMKSPIPVPVPVLVSVVSTALTLTVTTSDALIPLAS